MELSPVPAEQKSLRARTEHSSERKVQESSPSTSERKLQPWEQEVLNSWKSRSQFSQHRFSSEELEKFIVDHEPIGSVDASLQANATARNFYAYASGESRLVVTPGHMSIGERCKKARLDRERFQYRPQIGDDIGLFIRLLLLQLPLNAIEPVWSQKQRLFKAPASTCPLVFHRKYSVELSELLGEKCDPLQK